jgi:hypothetical protein
MGRLSHDIGQHSRDLVQNTHEERRYLGVITSRANMARAVRGPSHRIHTSLVPLKLCNWNCWNPNIQNHYF